MSGLPSSFSARIIPGRLPYGRRLNGRLWRSPPRTAEVLDRTEEKYS